MLQGPANRFGVVSFNASISKDLLVKVVVKGDKQKLKQAKTLIDAVLEKQRKQLKTAKNAAKKGDNVLHGAAAIYGYHSMVKLIKDAQLRVSGDELRVQYKAPVGAAMPVAIIGVMAAVAIPAFIKYTRKSKTVEATEGLDKIKAGAKAFFQADHYDTSGNLLPKAFPKTVGWTPASPCCKQGGKCRPKPSDWNHPSWRSLMFQLADPHYFQYRFESSGTNKGATFVIEARGDLDCDGVYSSYKILGSVDSEFGVKMRGPIITNEIE